MTVIELIAELQRMPQQHQVIVDLHSEWCVAAKPKLVEGFDSGGYVSDPRHAPSNKPVHGYVHIGPDYGK